MFFLFMSSETVLHQICGLYILSFSSDPNFSGYFVFALRILVFSSFRAFLYFSHSDSLFSLWAFLRILSNFFLSFFHFCSIPGFTEWFHYYSFCWYVLSSNINHCFSLCRLRLYSSYLCLLCCPNFEYYTLNLDYNNYLGHSTRFPPSSNQGYIFEHSVIYSLIQSI